MFLKNKFLAYLKEHNISIEQIAKLLGISKTTLYRKINGESDFFRSEIQKLTELIPKEIVLEIFFSEKVA